MLVGFTYLCTEDIDMILTSKCLSFFYQSTEGHKLSKVCGRELVNFLHGDPISVDGMYSNELVKITGNDLPMQNETCLAINGYNMCWDDIAKPYEFLEKKCQVIDGELWCLEHIEELYQNPQEQCVRYLTLNGWLCSDRIKQTWVTGGCVIINGKVICGNDFYKLAAQKCVLIDGQNVCPSALGAPHQMMEQFDQSPYAYL